MTPISGAQISDGMANKISVVQVYNPPGSGVVFYLQRHTLAWTAIASVVSQPGFYNGFDVNYYNTALPETGKRKLRVKDALNPVESAIELRIDNWPAPYPSSILFDEVWGMTSFADQTPTTYDDPIVVKPGSGVLFRPAQNQTYTILSVQGYTLPEN